MTALDKLKQGNEEWVAEIKKSDPDFFDRLAEGQAPEVLRIGCSDSRVPVNQVTGAMPGSIFVQRNIANMVVNTDTNLLSVVFYAVKALKVKHIVICGHYGCGGVKAAMGNDSIGMIDSWLVNIKNVYQKHEKELEAISDENKRFDTFVELNVKEQVQNMAKIAFIQEEWAAGNTPSIHGWVFSLKEGKVVDLNYSIDSKDQLEEIYRYN